MFYYIYPKLLENICNYSNVDCYVNSYSQSTMVAETIHILDLILLDCSSSIYSDLHPAIRSTESLVKSEVYL